MAGDPVSAAFVAPSHPHQVFGTVEDAEQWCREQLAARSS
jgi:hypothetical protein